MNSVSVILPSYNEKDNLPEAIERLEKSVADDLLEIIVVDDNSPDGSWKVVEDLKNPKVRVIRRMHEKGLASAIERGVAEARGDTVVWMDCDLGLPPEAVPRLVAGLSHADVVVGSRYVRGGADKRAFVRRTLSTLMNIYAMVVLSFKVRDYTSGFVAARTSVARVIGINPRGFGEYCIEFLYTAVKRGYRVAEVGYHYNYRKHGVSRTDTVNYSLFKFGAQYAWRILRLRFRVK